MPAQSLLPRAASLLLVLAASCSNSAPTPKGVLLISIDSLRADHLSSYGYRSVTRPSIPTTPVIDRLFAEEGTLFEAAFSTTSWTLPGHMAMLTGRPDELHGVRDLPDRLPHSVPMVQERFQDAGWHTAGFWSGPNLHPWFGFDRGFDSYVDCSSHGVDDPDAFALQDAAADRDEVNAFHDASHEGITGPKVVEAFDTWFDEVPADEPFFAFVHLWDVHYDYEPPAKFDIFDPDYEGTTTGHDITKKQFLGDARRDLAHLVSLYDGEIRFTDSNIGELLARLDAAGRLDNTLIVLTADHGEAFGEHGMLGHKHSLHTEEVHVPLLVRYPGVVTPGAVVTEPVGTVDVTPTILDFAKLAPLEGQWGRSLAPILTGKTDTLGVRALPLELTARYARRFYRGARWERYSVLEKNVDPAEGPKLRVFDLKSDPIELGALTGGRLAAQAERVREARDLWERLDAAAPEARTGEALPENLEGDLSKAGYLGGQDD